MAHDKAREFIAHRKRRPGPIEPRDTVDMLADSVDSDAFLEIAAEHLTEAGYTVELGFDDETGAACLYVEGYEVQFVRVRSHAARRKPVRH